ncbi:hypothetical protein KFK09_015745 [Dendrobium nobile]|uniref:Uncharacterized protein n=1 Tax=Dendrobium nobile TaxID=94219 RepID=A0A8T3B6Y2_DENNO|nr:hypothetical protein KFK09_015745 [Dendrobium nobile]
MSLFFSSPPLLSSSPRIDGLRRDGERASGDCSRQFLVRSSCLFGTFEESKDNILHFSLLLSSDAIRNKKVIH